MPLNNHPLFNSHGSVGTGRRGQKDHFFWGVSQGRARKAGLELLLSRFLSVLSCTPQLARPIGWITKITSQKLLASSWRLLLWTSYTHFSCGPILGYLLLLQISNDALQRAHTHRVKVFEASPSYPQAEKVGSIRNSLQAGPGLPPPPAVAKICKGSTLGILDTLDKLCK